MRDVKGTGPADRASASAAAKRAMLERFKARPGEDDPAVAARRAERQAIAEAREAREAERKARREREAAEAAERARIAEEERIAREAREVEERIERERQLEIERKAARDARYAARKALKRK